MSSRLFKNSKRNSSTEPEISIAVDFLPEYRLLQRVPAEDHSLQLVVPAPFLTFQMFFFWRLSEHFPPKSENAAVSRKEEKPVGANFLFALDLSQGVSERISESIKRLNLNMSNEKRRYTGCLFSSPAHIEDFDTSK